MLNISSIVVPTDFSKVSKSAFDYSVELADKMGSEIHLVHVMDINPPILSNSGAGSSRTDITALLEEEANKKMDTLIEQVNAENEIRLKKVLLKGRDYEEIVNYSKRVNSDIIVIATHARSGILLSLFGSVAENVIRYSHCPVLVIKPPSEA